MTMISLLPAIAILALSTAPEPTVATLYECKGKGVTLTYSTSNPANVPSITYQFGNATIFRQGEDIQTQDTVLGSLVTVVVRDIPDLVVESLTLVALTVNVTKGAPQATFVTRYFRTLSNTTIGGPGLVEGLLQESTARRVTCMASAPDRKPDR